MRFVSSLEGTPVDLAPWGYLYRSDLKIQSVPEAYFIPRRLKRVDEVYRTAYAALGPDQVKSPFYKQDDIANPLLPKPEGKLLTGMLWEGGLTDIVLTLRWPERGKIPGPQDIEARIFPTAWGWFGVTSDRILIGPEISENGRVWTYRSDPDWKMDWAYSMQVKAATELVAVFARKSCAVPEMKITSPALGNWAMMDVTIEWGFDPDHPYEFTGELDTHVAVISRPKYNPQKKTARLHCLYSPVSRYGNDSRLTVIIDREQGLGATVLLRELVNGPVLAPKAGLFIKKSDCVFTAAKYLQYCKKNGLKSYRERIAEHPEADSFEEIFRHTRLWRCPPDTVLQPFPDAPDPGADFSVPDPYWQAMYRHADNQLRGRHMWGMLTSEVARPALAMEMTGLHEDVDKIYDYFLSSPGVKSDGDFTDPKGSLEWAHGMRYDMGYFHEGTHSSTGKIMFSMLHRYLFTRDREWLDKRLPRIKQAADWILNEIRSYMRDIPNREKLHVYGLMPPAHLGDYALPASDWRWYYHDNAGAYMGLHALVRVLELIGDKDLPKYREATDLFTRNLKKALADEVLYAPVRKSTDGFSYPFIPRMAYAGGLLYYREETNVPQYNRGISDLYDGALLLGEVGSVLSSQDQRLRGTVDGMQEAGMKISLADLPKVDHPVADAQTKLNEAELEKLAASAPAIGPEAEDIWFWNTFADLPKISHNANVYLREDDIPNFLNFFMNHIVMMVGTNGLLWEHAHPNVFVECKDPDNGTAGWFVECFRNMLVTEDEDVLWIAKGTPRSWLKSGRTIRAKDVFTLYGPLTYSLESADGFVNVFVKVPSRDPVPNLKLRLRLPYGKQISNIQVLSGNEPVLASDGETLCYSNPTGEIRLRVALRSV